MDKYQKNITEAVKGMGADAIAAAITHQLRRIDDADESAAYLNGVQDVLMLLTDDSRTVLDIFHAIERRAEQ